MIWTLLSSYRDKPGQVCLQEGMPCSPGITGTSMFSRQRAELVSEASPLCSSSSSTETLQHSASSLVPVLKATAQAFLHPHRLHRLFRAGVSSCLIKLSAPRRKLLFSCPSFTRALVVVPFPVHGYTTVLQEGPTCQIVFYCIFIVIIGMIIII